MAPKRGRSSGGNFRHHKRKKLNLVALQEQLRQKKFYPNQKVKNAPSHPVDEEVTTQCNQKIKDTPEDEQERNNISESSESEEESASAFQQLMQEIGVKEDEPESEQDSEIDDSEDEENLMNGDGDDVEEEEGEGDEDMEEESYTDDGEEDDIEANGMHFLDDAAEDDNEIEEENGDMTDDEDEEEDNNDEDEEEDNDEESETAEDDDDDYEEQTDDDESEDSDEDEEELEQESEDNAVNNNHKKTLKQKKKQKALDTSSDEENSAQEGTGKKHKKTLKQKKKLKALDISSDENSAQEDTDTMSKSDPFSIHLEREVDVDEFLEKNKVWIKKDIKVPSLGKSLFSYRDPDFLRVVKSSTDLKGEFVKHKLCNKVAKTNAKFAGVDLKQGKSLSPFQFDLFNVLNTYQDLLYTKQTVRNAEEIRMVYCLHALNHVLKTRNSIISNDFKLRQGAKTLDEDVEYRDQGLTRPTVLIMLPYREKAKKVVNILMHLLSATEKVKAGSLKRFMEDFSEAEKTELAASNHKAEDYVKLFEGNIDDNFLIGLSISKSSLKLYTKRYGSDIIIASPLGLRSLINAPRDKRDFEFLSSIEVLIMDQTDVYMMQNWDHVVHSLQHFHLQPKASHNVDFSRVRMWAIDGLSKYFRQTVIFSNVLLPEFISLFNKYCHNYSGKIMVEKNEKVGSVRSCLSDVPQIFHRVACSKADGISQRNAKLEYFKTKLLYLHNAAGMRRTLIYCNYFSFVSLRNLFREEGLTFLFINEYDDEKEIKKSRRKFRQGLSPFLLHTERLHFHHRCRLRGACHIIWFDLPQYPVFYPELVNLLEITKQACTSTCLFTKYEGQKLMEIVGQKNAAHMLNSEKTVNMIALS